MELLPFEIGHWCIVKGCFLHYTKYEILTNWQNLCLAIVDFSRSQAHPNVHLLLTANSDIGFKSSKWSVYSNRTHFSELNGLTQTLAILSEMSSMFRITRFFFIFKNSKMFSKKLETVASSTPVDERADDFQENHS